MKLLYPIGSFFPAQEGGPDNAVYWLTGALAQRGIETTVITTMKGIHDSRIVPGERVCHGSVAAYYFPYYGEHCVCPGLYRWLVQHIVEYDAVHITSVFFPMSLLVCLIALWKRVPFIISPRGELDSGALCYHKGIKSLYLTAVQHFFRKACFFHVTSEQEAAAVRDILGHKVRCYVIPNGLMSIDQPFVPVDIYEKFSLQKNQPYILSLGRIDPKKALEQLIEAFALLRHDTIQLVIAGDVQNPYGKELQQLAGRFKISNRVYFVGAVDGDVKENLYSQAVLFVLPSHDENFGNVVVEALNRGTPVIASRGTPWQILEKQQCGFWVKNTPQALNIAMEDFLNKSQEEKAHYRMNAQKLVEERFNMQRLAEEYERMYLAVKK